MSTSKLLLALAVSVCLAQTTRADKHAGVDCESAEATACERCLPCVTLPVAAGTTTTDDKACDTCKDCEAFRFCQDCDAVATTPVGKYNDGCAAECLPCVILPNDGKTASKASCDTCGVCEEYALQCSQTGCKTDSAYFQACETECTQCIGGEPGDKTNSGASCDTCEVCEPLAKCAGSESAYQQGYATFCNSAEATACERCMPCVTLPVADGTLTTDGKACDTCGDCEQFELCQECDAGATTAIGKYNAACATECLPCTLLPNDGKTASGASCDTCEACEQYGLQCVAVECDPTTDYYKQCETECTLCITPGSKLTASGASCDTCGVCEPLVGCVGSNTEVAAKAAGVTAVSLKAKVPTADGIPAGGTIVCASLIIIGASAVAWIV